MRIEKNETDENEIFDIPNEIEEIIQILLNGLKDRDTVVRWSAAKVKLYKIKIRKKTRIETKLKIVNQNQNENENENETVNRRISKSKNENRNSE
jgi:hypothetical protein